MGSLSLPFKATSAMAILAEQRSALPDKSERSKSLRRSNSGRLLKSTTYEDNFNFCFNYYQPMIDYLDKKVEVQGTTLENKEPLPHLKYLEEQSFENASSSSGKMKRSYTDRDLKRLIEHAQLEKGQSGERTPVSGKLQKYGSRGQRTVTFIDSHEDSNLAGKLGVNKSTFHQDQHPEYSMTKESLKTSLLSKSAGALVDAVSEKLKESKRRLKEDLERESQESRRSSLRSRNRQVEDDFGDGTSAGLRRSHSFGAFTKKAARVMEDEMVLKSLVQASQLPLARSISNNVKEDECITELHSPLSFQRGDSTKSVVASTSRRTASVVSRVGNENDNEDNEPVDNAPRYRQPVRFSVKFDDTSREADAEYWKELW